MLLLNCLLLDDATFPTISVPIRANRTVAQLKDAIEHKINRNSSKRKADKRISCAPDELQLFYIETDDADDTDADDRGGLRLTDQEHVLTLNGQRVSCHELEKKVVQSNAATKLVSGHTMDCYFAMAPVGFMHVLIKAPGVHHERVDGSTNGFNRNEPFTKRQKNEQRP